MRLVLGVRPPYAARVDTGGSTVITSTASPGTQITVGALSKPAASPHLSVEQFLRQLGEPKPTLLADEQRRSRHGWPVRICRAQAEAFQAVLVYYLCLDHSAEIIAHIPGTAHQTTLAPGLLALLLSGRPDFRENPDAVVALSEIWRS